jgi:hypothetical protein
MIDPRRRKWLLASLVPALFLSACGLKKKVAVGSAASLMENVARSAYRQSDLRLIREGMPAYLMLLDGMVDAWPTNERLLMAAAQAYASFAAAFTEETDQDFSVHLYGRAKDYALRALARRGVAAPSEQPYEAFEKAVAALTEADVPYAFWAAATWGNWISLNQGSMAAMAQLPKVVKLMERVLALDEAFYHGGPHLFMGIWFASRPKMAGGDLDKARAHFDMAVALGDGKFLMTAVYYAYHYARRAFDRALFESLLEGVLATPADVDPELSLVNTAAHQRARRLLDEADTYF